MTPQQLLETELARDHLVIKDIADIVVPDGISISEVFDPDLGIVQASGGGEGTVFYVGNAMSTAKRLWKWTEGMAAWCRTKSTSSMASRAKLRSARSPSRNSRPEM